MRGRWLRAPAAVGWPLVCTPLAWAAMPGVTELASASGQLSQNVVRNARWYGRSLPARLEQRELRRRGRAPGAARPGERPQPSLPAGTDLLPQIKHIVVLMMENHSYDNYLGMLAGRGMGFPLGDDGRPAVTNLDAEGNPVRPFPMP